MSSNQDRMAPLKANFDWVFTESSPQIKLGRVPSRPTFNGLRPITPLPIFKTEFFFYIYNNKHRENFFKKIQ